MSNLKIILEEFISVLIAWTIVIVCIATVAIIGLVGFNLVKLLII